MRQGNCRQTRTHRLPKPSDDVDSRNKFLQLPLVRSSSKKCALCPSSGQSVCVCAVLSPEQNNDRHKHQQQSTKSQLRADFLWRVRRSRVCQVNFFFFIVENSLELSQLLVALRKSWPRRARERERVQLSYDLMAVSVCLLSAISCLSSRVATVVVLFSRNIIYNNAIILALQMFLSLTCFRVSLFKNEHRPIGLCAADDDHHSRLFSDAPLAEF